MFKNHGISALEIVIAVAILAILSAIVFASLGGFRASQIVSATAEQAVGMLQRAHAKTLASEENTQFGVHFSASKIVLYTGALYTDGDPNNIEYVVPANIAMATSLVDGGSDVLFARLTGDTGTPGSITFTSATDGSKTKTITVSSHGVIELQ